MPLAQEPFLTEALRQGSGVRIVGQDEMYPNFTLGVTAFSIQLYENRPLAKAVVKAYIRASRAYNDAVSGRTPPSDRAQIDALLARYTKIDEATVREMTPTGVSPNGGINLESQLYCHQFFVDERLVPQPLTEAQLATVFATDLVDEVLAEMGRVPEGA
jgi:ABC-type nitrate/sulfonate/bicarbonate transport system substrate-binding protein